MGWAASVAVRLGGMSAARRFEAATRDPVAAQQRMLLEIAERNRHTEYGRRHGFRGVRQLREWQAQLPVVTYEDLRPLVDRMLRGERNILTAEDAILFARTSGTTGEPKYIPITPTCQRRGHRDQLRVWFHHACRDHPTLFQGRVVTMVSPAVEGWTPGGIPYGSMSGHLHRTMPRLVRGTYLVPYQVFEAPDYESKYYATMRLGLGARVTFLATANPSSILKLCETGQAWAEALLRDLHDGTLRSDIDLPLAARQAVLNRCRPERERARRLAAAREKRGGRFLPADYWPDLAMIGCWKGGTVASHTERFGEWFDPDGHGGVPIRDWGYLSSEARVSIPLSDQGSAGVLAVSTAVCEFVEARQVEDHPEEPPVWDFLGVDEIEAGGEYHIILTTTGGLYRYDINDVVQVVGHHHRTPVIEFRRKGRGMTSITGEKVSVSQVMAAVDAASRELALRIDHFKVEADASQLRYLFKLESSRGIPPPLRLPLLQAVDRHLADLNLEYASKRRSRRLRPPVLLLMRPGWYDRGKKRLAAQGKHLFQAKTVLLSWSLPEDQEELLEATVEMPEGPSAGPRQ